MAHLTHYLIRWSLFLLVSPWSIFLFIYSPVLPISEFSLISLSFLTPSVTYLFSFMYHLSRLSLFIYLFLCLLTPLSLVELPGTNTALALAPPQPQC